MPKVSIIVANYNNSRYLGECLISLQQQTFQDYEVLVFDDASTDNSDELIQTFTSKDKRFKLIALPENKGVAYLRSISLNYCLGDYVAILDADDYSEKRRLERQVSVLDAEPDTVLVGGFYAIIDENGKLISKQKTIATTDLELRWGMSTGNSFVHSTVMFRKSAALAADGYNANMLCAEDMDFYSRIMLQGKLRAIPHVLSYWRTHAISYSQQKHEAIIKGTYTVLRQTAARLLNKNISLFEAAALFHNTMQAADSASSLLVALDILLAYRNLYWEKASSDRERGILLRCHLQSLLRIRKRNRKLAWYPQVLNQINGAISEIIRNQGYAWFIDSKLKISTRNWFYLCGHSIKQLLRI